MKYLGYENALADMQSTVFSTKTDVNLMEVVVQRALDNAVSKLQKKYDEFKTKTPILTTNPITAEIGMKEGLEKGDKFEVLEAQQNSEGIIKYIRKGVVKAVTIWDNRYMAENEAKGSDASRLKKSTFKGSGDYQPGMMLRQIK